MEQFDIYGDIGKRTDGDIYIGVVGPVRAGKSTFITNFMNIMVLPKIRSKHARERMIDELPQSANGRSIMTTQPKFVPGEAASVKIADKIEVKVRLVDCVGYLIDGAVGHMEGEKPRMVNTPWSSEAIPFEEAAETGTRKVISEHSTVGVVMTSDGTIDTELSRAPYVAAEERVVSELKELGKPFVVILNSKVPSSSETLDLARELEKKYSTPVLTLNVLELCEADVENIFSRLLMEFPLRDVDFCIDKWLQALPVDNEIISALNTKLLSLCDGMRKMADYKLIEENFSADENFAAVSVSAVEAGKGRVVYNVVAKPELFYKALSSACGVEIADDFALMANMKEFAYAKKEYDKLRAAIKQANECGYGVVAPSCDDLKLEEPQVVRQGSRYGVKLRATAPSLHIMQVDIAAEVSPVIASEMQNEETVKNMLAAFDENPKGIWETDMFGKSMYALVNENICGKLSSMTEDTQKKMRRALSRIVNEGKGGVICILI